MSAARTRGLGAALVALAALAAPVAPVAARDYDLDPERWNGLGYLLTTADEARVELALGDSVDLGALEPDDVLMLLYPSAPLPEDDLLAFVESGGYLIVADDQGSAGSLLARLGITRRETGPSAHLTYWDQQEGFPLLRPAGQHFLFFNVKEIVTNYPAAFTIPAARAAQAEVSLTPILSFEGGREHFAVEAALGGGRVLALSDPSVFLNDMLRRFYGDKQLAANVLRVYCQREPCSARLVRPGATFSGRFDAERARLGNLPKEIEARVAEINEALAQFSAAAAEPPWAVMIVLGAALALLLLGARVRGREKSEVPGLMPAVPSQISSPSLDAARGLVAQRHEADFSHLALTLAEFALDKARRVDLESFARIAPAAQEDSGARDELRAALLRVEAETASLRSRQPPIWSADRFLRLHDDVQVLLRSLPDAGRHRRTARI